jgi:hypothetical protein
MSKEDCTKAIGINCLEKIVTGLNTSGEIRQTSDADLAKMLSNALGGK